MFKFFKSKQPPRVYLKSVVIVPRNDFFKIEEWGAIRSVDFEECVRVNVEDVFSLPKLSSRTEEKENDLALEVIVSGVRGGLIDSFGTGSVVIPLIWRPKIKFASRLFNIKTGKTTLVTKHTQKMPWLQFLALSFRLKAFFGLEPAVSSERMNILAVSGCVQLLSKIKDRI